MLIQPCDIMLLDQPLVFIQDPLDSPYGHACSRSTHNQTNRTSIATEEAIGLPDGVHSYLDTHKEVVVVMMMVVVVMEERKGCVGCLCVCVCKMLAIE
jgi:hypothetical protein